MLPWEERYSIKKSFERKKKNPSPYISKPPPSSSSIQKLLDEDQNEYEYRCLDNQSDRYSYIRKNVKDSKFLRKYTPLIDNISKKNISLTPKETAKVNRIIKETLGNKRDQSKEDISELQNSLNVCNIHENGKYSPLYSFYSCQIFSYSQEVKDDEDEKELAILVHEQIKKPATSKHINKSEFQENGFIDVQEEKSVFETPNHGEKLNEEKLTTKGNYLLFSKSIIIQDMDYEKLFDEDWDKCNISDVVKDGVERKRIRGHFRKEYKHIVQIFHYYSSCDGLLTGNPMVLKSKRKLFDDLNIFGDFSGKYGIHEKPIARFELIELFFGLVRIVYFHPNTTTELSKNTFNEGMEMSAAVQQFLENKMKEVTKRIFDVNQFRMDYYVTENVKHVYEANIKELLKIFLHFSDHIHPQTQISLLSFDGYIEFLEALCQYVGGLDRLTASYMYVTCKAIDSHDNSIGIDDIEFMEIIGRIAYIRVKEDIMLNENKLKEIKDIDEQDNLITGRRKAQRNQMIYIDSLQKSIQSLIKLFQEYQMTALRKKGLEY